MNLIEFITDMTDFVHSACTKCKEGLEAVPRLDEFGRVKISETPPEIVRMYGTPRYLPDIAVNLHPRECCLCGKTVAPTFLVFAHSVKTMCDLSQSHFEELQEAFEN